jgi:flavin-dependent dehydrogenase
MAAKLDLVVVGGGPAGISTALHVLAAAPELASRMVVLEKARYPRDKYCAGAIGGRALRLLDRIGVRVAVPTVAVHAISLRAAGEVVVGREPDLGVVVRRVEFDAALAREAARRGVEVREGTGVARVEAGMGGVRVTLDSGEALDARVVVGADGVAGAVRRSAGLSRPRLRAQAIEADTEAVAGDAPRDTLHFDFDEGDLPGYGWDFPTPARGPDGEGLVCRGIYRIARADDVQNAAASGRDDVRGRFARYLGRRGLDVGRYRLKPFAEQGFDDREAASVPRVLLVGEAAGIDIATGEGIAQAIQYGALAGPYLARAFALRDFSFGDWLTHVRSATLGWQLRERLWFCRRFYGAGRPVMERLLVGMPAALRLGMLQFAGKAIGPAALARVVSEALPEAAHLGPGRVLQALRS